MSISWRGVSTGLSLSHSSQQLLWILPKASKFSFENSQTVELILEGSNCSSVFSVSSIHTCRASNYTSSLSPSERYTHLGRKADPAEKEWAGDRGTIEMFGDSPFTCRSFFFFFFSWKNGANIMARRTCPLPLSHIHSFPLSYTPNIYTSASPDLHIYFYE